MEFELRGFIVPPKFRQTIKFVNGTPHLSQLGAKFHNENIIKLGDRDDLSDQIYEWLKQANVKGCDQAYNLYKKMKPDDVVNVITNSTKASRLSYQYTSVMLKEPETEWKQDPTLSNTDYPKVVNKLIEATETIQIPGLKAFEYKSTLKYASDASRRNLDTYVKQVIDNYLPSRPAFANMDLPNMIAYDRSLQLQYDMFHSNLSEADKMQRLINQGDFISLARQDSSGGAPFFKNQGDFINLNDPDDFETWADRYSQLALLWLFLPVKYKREVSDYFVYMALERVQAGGLESYTGDEQQLSDFKTKPNKQRFVQAESAIFPKAFKSIHDVMLSVWKSIPFLSNDKYSEELTTDGMKQIALFAKANGYTIQGADYTNYDASIELSMLNDSYFNVIRQNMPKWINSYIVDPYYHVAFQTGVFVIGVGYVRTTGIKSGMIITNQGDCYHANLCDIYEIVRYVQTRGGDVNEISL